MTKVSNLRTLTNIDPKDSITVAPAYNSYHTSCIICKNTFNVYIYRLINLIKLVYVIGV